MIMRNIIAVLLLCAVLTPAHAFLVTDFDGGRIETDDFIGNGRWTVVMLWQLNCVPCEQQKPAVEAFHNKYKASKAHVVGLVMDGHEYIPQIKQFLDKKPTAFPSLVVFGDVFKDQIKSETGKHFPAAPGYIVYTPEGEIKMALNSIVEIDELISYLESQFVQ